MKRTTQRPRTTSKVLPHVLGAAEAARVKGGATAIEYGLMLAPTAVEYTLTRPPGSGSE